MKEQESKTTRKRKPKKLMIDELLPESKNLVYEKIGTREACRYRLLVLYESFIGKEVQMNPFFKSDDGIIFFNDFAFNGFMNEMTDYFAEHNIKHEYTICQRRDITDTIEIVLTILDDNGQEIWKTVKEKGEVYANSMDIDPIDMMKRTLSTLQDRKYDNSVPYCRELINQIISSPMLLTKGFAFDIEFLMEDASFRTFSGLETIRQNILAILSTVKERLTKLLEEHQIEPTKHFIPIVVPCVSYDGNLFKFYDPKELPLHTNKQSFDDHVIVMDANILLIGDHNTKTLMRKLWLEEIDKEIEEIVDFKLTKLLKGKQTVLN